MTNRPNEKSLDLRAYSDALVVEPFDAQTRKVRTMHHVQDVLAFAAIAMALTGACLAAIAVGYSG